MSRSNKGIKDMIKDSRHGGSEIRSSSMSGTDLYTLPNVKTTKGLYHSNIYIKIICTRHAYRKFANEQNEQYRIIRQSRRR